MVQVVSQSCLQRCAAPICIVECFPTSVSARVMFSEELSAVILLKELVPATTNQVTNRAPKTRALTRALPPSKISERRGRDYIVVPSPIALARGLLVDNGTKAAWGTEAVWSIGAGNALVLPSILVDAVAVGVVGHGQSPDVENCWI